jgi:hypothetical protein
MRVAGRSSERVVWRALSSKTESPKRLNLSPRPSSNGRTGGETKASQLKGENVEKVIKIGEGCGREIVLVNPDDKSWTSHRYILCFGAYGWTRLMVWANHLDGALDEAIDWIADNAPGLLANDEVQEAYEAAIAEGKSEEEAAEEAEEDTTRGGNCGHYLNSWEWGILAEDPTREDLKNLIKGA